MGNNTSAATGGLTFCDILCIVFVVLKLTKVISWSWWWVLSPVWIPVALLLVGGVIYGILTAISKRP